MIIVKLNLELAISVISYFFLVGEIFTKMNIANSIFLLINVGKLMKNLNTFSYE